MNIRIAFRLARRLDSRPALRLALIALLAWPGAALARGFCDDPALAGMSADKLAAVSSLSPYGESSALLNRMSNNGWATRDETALRGRFSFKYTVCGNHYVPRSARPNRDEEPVRNGWELFLSYTGEFDFYDGTRASGPVINRLNNPAINLRLPAQALLGRNADDNFTLSLEHRSNGQVTDVTTPEGQASAGRAYRNGDRPYFDAISRGSNYVGLAFDLADVDKAGLDLRLKLRLYFDQDSDITWGPMSGQGLRIADYDRLQLHAAWRTGAGWFDLDWRLGDQGLRTDSWTLGYQIPIRELPLYLRYHRGPLNTLSNYTQRQDSIGIGLRFARPF